MIPARQSTALELSIGPILDADGVAVTGGVVGDFKIKKTTGNFAALNGSATLTHVSAGTYDLVLTTSDTDTVGLCSIAIDDGVNACAPVYLQVMEEAVYDMLYAASATGYIANQPVDVNTIKTQTVTCAAGVTVYPAVGTTATVKSNHEIVYSTDFASNYSTSLDRWIVQLAGATHTSAVIPTVTTTTTATNLTNAPTSGDFTATMKTSIGTAVAASAVASVTAGVTLADDAITSAKYDESTAFPLKSNDAGSTAVARVGADSDTLETLSDQLDGIAGNGKVVRAAHLGDLAEDVTLTFLFNTLGANNAPITLAGTPAVSVYKGNSTTQLAEAAALTVDLDSLTGTHAVTLDLSSDAFYATGENYTVVITTGTVDGDSVVGTVVGSFSIENRFDEVDVVALGGAAQSLLDLKDLADDGYDPSTNKIAGVVLADTLTTYTGNTPQTGDGYAIVNSGTHGNAALKTLIDAAKAVVDAIKTSTDNLPSDPADASAVAAATDALQAVVDDIQTQVGVAGAGLTAVPKTGFKLASDGLNLVVPADPSAIPALGTANIVTLIGYFGAWSLNEVDATSSTVKLRNSADSADLATHAVSDDATTFVSEEAA